MDRSGSPRLRAQDLPPAPTARGPRLGALFLLAGFVGLDALSCAARPPSVEPILPAASVALAEARQISRRGGAEDEDWKKRARARAEEAQRIDPTWVAPGRFLDDLERGELLAAEALGRRLAELEANPDDAGLQYLVGRLEGPAGLPRFERAQELEPELAWAHHGEGWMRFRSGSRRGALKAGHAALERARDDWERLSFALALARYEQARERVEAAVALLAGLRDAPGLAPGDRIELEVELARLELSSLDEVLTERGFWRAIELLRSEDPTPAEVRLLATLALVGVDRLGYSEAVEELAAALASRPGAERDRWRARFLLERGAARLGLGALERAADGTGVASPASASLRAARFARGDGARVIDDWLAALPPQVLAGDGLPRRPELRVMVRTAREEHPENRVEGSARLAESMLAAGWFREARGIAPTFADADLERALAVDARAAAGLSLLGGLRRLLDLVDDDEDYSGPRGRDVATTAAAGDASPEPPAPASIGDLGALLEAMQPLFDRHGALDADTPLRASPVLSFGPFGRVVHPGPAFSATDAGRDLGEEGAAVEGLGAELLALGRFGIFGQSMGGGGPDGTVLRLLALEERSGAHLGVPYAGWVAWCEGTDVPSRPMRRGARISGAALHEGYWIDVEGVRTELARWRELERAFLDRDDEGLRARTALAGRGPHVPAGAGDAVLVAAYAPLGEADRVRLAVLSERPERAGGRMQLGELLEVVARHEEGHLTDRSRFLPLSKHFFSALRLLFQAGLSARKVGGMLEYRAQLVALCVADDPRLPLAECLDAAEDGPGLTPHAQAYTELLGDLLAALLEDRARIPELDTEHYLIHQLHHIGAEDVRRAALRLAQAKGLVAE